VKFFCNANFLPAPSPAIVINPHTAIRNPDILNDDTVRTVGNATTANTVAIISGNSILVINHSMWSPIFTLWSMSADQAPRDRNSKESLESSYFLIVPQQRFLRFTLDLHIYFFYSPLYFRSLLDCELSECDQIGGDIVYCAYIDRQKYQSA
jgi:hypothetical protein